METERKNIDGELNQESGLLNSLDSMLMAVRVVASVGAVIAIGIGVVMAIQLFGFIRGIIDNPETHIAQWQLAMDQSRMAGTPLPVEDAPVESSGEAQNATPAASVPATAAEAEDASSAPVPPAESVGDSTGSAVPNTASSGIADEAPGRAVSAKAPLGPDPDVPAYIALADRVMDRLEGGQYSWLIGVGVLVVFCWLLVKVPVMLITLGTRLLVGLVNVSSD